MRDAEAMAYRRPPVPPNFVRPATSDEHGFSAADRTSRQAGHNRGYRALAVAIVPLAVGLLLRRADKQFRTKVW